ncbi:hypothetical protein MalM25_05050 [Planctomycetes bacterium MalM25]|nr:hypothetical protein MalM25_05050 [Planctomycetes bacterium MalM25]
MPRLSLREMFALMTVVILLICWLRYLVPVVH